MMPHITAQCLSTDTAHTDHRHAVQQKKSGESRKNERLTSSGIHLDLRCLSTKSLLAIPDASSATNRSPQTQKFNVLPTPTSTTSIVFDSPQKSSPSSSSISSTNALAIMQRANTPIAELEDTSLAYTYPELEDTSNHALRSRGVTKMPSYAFKSDNSTFRSLISAVDQHFADSESENRFLRKSLAEAQKSIRKAREVLDDSNHALYVAQGGIADRDYEIQIKNNLIAELEKDVKQCQQHHPPPAPPSKWRGSDGAVSRFNVDTNRSPESPETTHSAASLSRPVGRPFAVSPQQSSEGSRTVSAPKTPRSTFGVASSCSPSPSTTGSPFPQHYRRNQDPKSGAYTSLTAEALITALSSAAGTSITPAKVSEGHRSDGYHVRQSSLEVSGISPNNSSSVSAAQQSRRSSRRVMQSSASSPNLRDTQTNLPWSDAPAMPSRPPIMSGGLGISENPNKDIREHRLRKKRVGLGDLFRRKEQGGMITNESVKALDFCGS